MKILVFSDIHGSFPVVCRMAELIEEHDPAAALLLGDILYHGPRNPLPEGYNPRAAARALSPLAPRLIAVKGNCDSEVDENALTMPLAPAFVWLLDEKARADGRPLRIFATHGHHFNPQHMPPLEKGDVLLFGHTHVPLAETAMNGVRLCNPGSLALPKEGSPPCYGLFENGIFSVLTEDGRLYAQLDCR